MISGFLANISTGIPDIRPVLRPYKVSDPSLSDNMYLQCNNKLIAIIPCKMSTEKLPECRRVRSGVSSARAALGRGSRAEALLREQRARPRRLQEGDTDHRSLASIACFALPQVLQSDGVYIK